jgi:hypothetical protein
MELTNLKKRTYERCTLKNRSCDWKDLLAAMAIVFLASTITIWEKFADQSCNWRLPKFLGLVFNATLTRQGLLLKSLKNNRSWTSCTSPLMILYCRVCQLLRACWDWEFAWPWKNKYLRAVFYWRFSLIYFQRRQAAYYRHHCHYTIVAAEFSGAPPSYATNTATMSSEILGQTNHIITWYTNPYIDDIYYRLPTASSCILCDWEFSWPWTIPASGSLSTILLALFSTQTSRLLQARLPFSNCLLQNFLAASPFF